MCLTFVSAQGDPEEWPGDPFKRRAQRVHSKPGRFPYFFLARSVFFFSFMPSCLHLLAFHSFLVWPLMCTCTSTCTVNPGFRSPRFHEVGFIVCPVHLVPLHRNLVHLCPVSPCLHLFVLAARACALALTLVFLRRVCACVNLGNLRPSSRIGFFYVSIFLRGNLLNVFSARGQGLQR